MPPALVSNFYGEPLTISHSLPEIICYWLVCVPLGYLEGPVYALHPSLFSPVPPHVLLSLLPFPSPVIPLCLSHLSSQAFTA